MSRFQKILVVLCFKKVVCCSHDANYCLRRRKFRSNRRYWIFFSQCKVNQSVRLTSGHFEIFRKIRSEFVTLTYCQVLRMCLKLMNFQNVFKINIRDLRCFYCLLWESFVFLLFFLSPLNIYSGVWFSVSFFLFRSVQLFRNLFGS